MFDAMRCIDVRRARMSRDVPRRRDRRAKCVNARRARRSNTELLGASKCRMAATVTRGDSDMNSTTETFLAQSRSYLLGSNAQAQPDAKPDLIERAIGPSPGSRRHGARGTRRTAPAAAPAR
jgi:hypothetical protein